MSWSAPPATQMGLKERGEEEISPPPDSYSPPPDLSAEGGLAEELAHALFFLQACC